LNSFSTAANSRKSVQSVNYLAKVGVEGSNPFARSNQISKLALVRPGNFAPGKQGVSSAIS
jgi:hypothetical protein